MSVGELQRLKVAHIADLAEAFEKTKGVRKMEVVIWRDTQPAKITLVKDDDGVLSIKVDGEDLYLAWSAASGKWGKSAKHTVVPGTELSVNETIAMHRKAGKSKKEAIVATLAEMNVSMKKMGETSLRDYAKGAIPKCEILAAYLSAKLGGKESVLEMLKRLAGA